MNYTQSYLNACVSSINSIHTESLDHAVDHFYQLRERKGRLFIAGSGGGAGHASHAAADFRRLAGIESYAVGDNISELTALINDESWEYSYALSLAQSNFSSADMLLVLSVGGGNLEKNVSVNLINAVKHCLNIKGKVIGVASNSGGFVGKHSDLFVSIPVTDSSLTTPICESIQALVWHLMVSHPKIKVRPTHWESLGGVS